VFAIICHWFLRNLFDFLPYKPGASHPVASAPFKALKCFCLSPLLAEKLEPSRAEQGMVVGFYSPLH
jgi:hypothetical protein